MGEHYNELSSARSNPLERIIEGEHLILSFKKNRQFIYDSLYESIRDISNKLKWLVNDSSYKAPAVSFDEATPNPKTGNISFLQNRFHQSCRNRKEKIHYLN